MLHWFCCIYNSIRATDPGLTDFQRYIKMYYLSLLLISGDDVQVRARPAFSRENIERKRVSSLLCSVFVPQPLSEGEMFFGCLLMVLGAVLNAVIFANVAALVTQLTTASDSHNQRWVGRAEE